MSEKNEKYGGWISVKDKLPEMSNCVLITDGENIEMSRYDEGVWRTESPCCYGEILYWQPLPDISAIYHDVYEKEQKMDNLINNTSEPTNDYVNHPAHYTAGSIEVIDFLEAWNFPFHLANAIKYICRAGRKDKSKTKEDLEKAIWYIKRYIKFVEENKNEDNN